MNAKAAASDSAHLAISPRVLAGGSAVLMSATDGLGNVDEAVAGACGASGREARADAPQDELQTALLNQSSAATAPSLKASLSEGAPRSASPTAPTALESSSTPSTPVVKFLDGPRGITP